jgi:hypothetical protein
VSGGVSGDDYGEEGEDDAGFVTFQRADVGRLAARCARRAGSCAATTPARTTL